MLQNAERINNAQATSAAAVSLRGGRPIYCWHRETAKLSAPPQRDDKLHRRPPRRQRRRNPCARVPKVATPKIGIVCVDSLPAGQPTVSRPGQGVQVL